MKLSQLQKSFVFTGLLGICLVGCASTGTATKTDLMAGIDVDKSAAPADPLALRSERDPVCVNFYQNVRTLRAQSQVKAQPSATEQFVTNVGFSALTGLASASLGGVFGNSIGGIAAQSAANSALYQAGAITLQSARSAEPQEQYILQTANDLRCPVIRE